MTPKLIKALLICLIAAIFFQCSGFQIFPEKDRAISVRFFPLEELIAEQKEKYEQSVKEWKKSSTQKNLDNMRLQKQKLRKRKRSSKSGLLLISCSKCRFNEQKTVSITVLGKRGEEWLGVHTFVGLGDTIRLNVDLVPVEVVVVDQVSKEELRYKKGRF